ncbi:MAG: c-type cytochrome [SAR324 cluster bacterium]|nr:c-type cytochrome [SAR324 cluster bacterium]
MRKFFTLSLCLFFMTPMVAFADGKALFKSKGCAVCHGADGKKKSGMIPKVAGLDAAATAQKLADYQAKKVQSKTAGMMSNNPKVKSLTPDDIKAIAGYLANIK